MFEQALEIIREGIQAGNTPCCALAVGCGDKLMLKEFLGFRQVHPEKEPLNEDTLFDLASLTKLTATTMVALRLLEQGKL